MFSKIIPTAEMPTHSPSLGSPRLVSVVALRWSTLLFAGAPQEPPLQVPGSQAGCVWMGWFPVTVLVVVVVVAEFVTSQSVTMLQVREDQPSVGSWRLSRSFTVVVTVQKTLT